MQLDSFAFFIVSLFQGVALIWPWILGLVVLAVLLIFFGKRKPTLEEKTKSDGL